jgi:hypothetical protein
LIAQYEGAQAFIAGWAHGLLCVAVADINFHGVFDLLPFILITESAALLAALFESNKYWLTI